MSLIAEMQKPSSYGLDATSSVELIETHISWVFLTAKHAYKVKKPVVTAFLDYSTLARRKQFCEREVELDARYAKALYLGVIPITRQGARLRVEGAGPVVEYAVKMHRFPNDSLLSERLSQDVVSDQEIKSLATHIAEFHGRARCAIHDMPFGEPQGILQDAVDNLDALEQSSFILAKDRKLLAELRRWTAEQFALRLRQFDSRKQNGFIRECHGDLHCGNVVFWDQQWVPFDGIEFNERFRWIDSLSDLAFLAMDLHVRNHPRLAHLLVNSYVEASGDYEALALLRWYMVYRGLVRAKVVDLVQTQHAPGSDTFQNAAEEKSKLLTFARTETRIPRPTLWITHGLSGSGKSTRAETIVRECGAIRIRSDVERKRMAELEPTFRPAVQQAEQLYAATATEDTYARLLALAESLLTAGYSVVVDATFLMQQRRRQFAKLADTHQLAYRILDCQADVATLQQRLAARQQLGTDPSDADVRILESQLACQEPLSAEEQLQVD